MKKLEYLSESEYTDALQSGMFWEWYPNATGIFSRDVLKILKRLTNYYHLNRLDNKIIIKRDRHQAKYYYVEIVRDSTMFDVKYVGEWEMRPGIELNKEPTHQFIESFKDIFEAFEYIESLNGNSDLH